MVVTAQSFRADANANWALASWPPLIILTALWLTDAGKRLRLIAMAGIAVNGALVLIITISTMIGSFGAFTPESDPLRRLRGWDHHYRDLVAMTEELQADTIITTRREHIAKMIWHFRHDPITIELVDPDGIAQNHFEQKLPWKPQPRRRVIAINQETTPPPLDGIQWQDVRQESTVKISAKRQRGLVYHFGIEQ